MSAMALATHSEKSPPLSLHDADVTHGEDAHSAEPGSYLRRRFGMLATSSGAPLATPENEPNNPRRVSATPTTLTRTARRRYFAISSDDRRAQLRECLSVIVV